MDDSEFTDVEQVQKEGANGSIDIEGGSGSSGAAINSDSGMRFKINKNGERNCSFLLLFLETILSTILSRLEIIVKQE